MWMSRKSPPVERWPKRLWVTNMQSEASYCPTTLLVNGHIPTAPKLG